VKVIAERVPLPRCLSAEGSYCKEKRQNLFDGNIRAKERKTPSKTFTGGKIE